VLHISQFGYKSCIAIVAFTGQVHVYLVLLLIVGNSEVWC